MEIKSLEAVWMMTQMPSPKLPGYTKGSFNILGQLCEQVKANENESRVQ